MKERLPADGLIASTDIHTHRLEHMFWTTKPEQSHQAALSVSH